MQKLNMTNLVMAFVLHQSVVVLLVLHVPKGFAPADGLGKSARRFLTSFMTEK